MIFTEKAQKLLAALGQDRIGIDGKLNPFQKEGGLLYLRHDGIVVTNARDEFGGVNVGFKWRSDVMCWVRVEGVRLENYTELHLSGFDGRQRVDLERG